MKKKYSVGNFYKADATVHQKDLKDLHLLLCNEMFQNPFKNETRFQGSLNILALKVAKYKKGLVCLSCWSKHCNKLLQPVKDAHKNQ